MVPTLRRLNDRERYYGLTFPGWLAVALAGAVLYGAVKISPFGARATVTTVVLALAFMGMVIAGVAGQALSPVRHLLALVRYLCAPRRFEPPDRPGRHGGLVLDSPRELPDYDEESLLERALL